MPPQFTYPPRRYLPGYLSSPSHPYATHCSRYPEYVPLYHTMNDQTIDPGDDTQGIEKSGSKKRNRRRMGPKAKKAEASKQADKAEVLALATSMQSPQSQPHTNARELRQAAPMLPYHQAGGQIPSYQALMSTGPGLSGLGPQLVTKPKGKSKVFQVQQWRQFHGNPAARPSAKTQPVDRGSKNINDDFDKLNLKTENPFLLTTDFRVPHRRPAKKYFTEDDPDRIRLSKKWVPEDPADATGYRDGWTQRDHKMAQIVLPPPLPTEEYLLTARTPTKPVDNPTKRKLLVILDLNGTLLCRTRMLNGCRDKYNPWPRTNLPPFLDYLFREHHVVVFSSAMQGTILNLLKATMAREHRSKILRIFTREDMEIPHKYFKLKVSTFKRLSMVWDALADQNSNWQFDQTNTVLMDDSTEKASSEPHNHLLVPEYTVDIHNTGGDEVLGNIAGYLEEVRKWGNVSAYIRENPFDKDRDYPKPEGWVPHMDVYTPGPSFDPNPGYIIEGQEPPNSNFY
ncbi:hypothetical protein TWF106_001196 [Orbilia oligospora]|uniref:Mitochondrial import inner membrane translocase subunit TIM50 n=1 Tax=Orbilia oligospora TaxID=2813651 RepID=A0A7C8QBU1_ORBOL|nr:hypothetical protein TWF106_001196 [Orbilia oligospora]